MKLRKYQDKAVQYAVEMLEERGNALIVAGTGAGKTIMMAGAIGRYFNGFYATHRRKPHVLVLVHRTEIHDQNHTKFSMVCPHIPTSEITANRKSLHGYVHFGMVQTVSNLLEDFKAAGSFFDLIVIDECHHAAASTYEDIIEWNNQGNPDAALLGVTATSNRGDKRPLIHLFDSFYQITTKFLIDNHYLVRPTFKDLSPVFTIHNKKTKTVLEKGHLAKNCVLDEAGKALISKLCDDYLENKEHGKSVIFAPSHYFCIAIYNELQERGRKPAYLSLGLDDVTRKEEIERFENGDCDELINVDICTEGYDFPPLRNIVDFDTNGTHGQWVQKVGRVLRTAPEKTSCFVIDFGGNVELYPQGVDIDVDLNGVVKKLKGKKLTEEDFFREVKEKNTAIYNEPEGQEHTPYHPPVGFETVGDTDMGVVFVACGKTRDCLIVANVDRYMLFTGNKQGITKSAIGTFDACVKRGIAWVGDLSKKQNANRPIGKLQVQYLAPEYPTTALSWYGANCCICWKTWKSEVISCMKQKQP